MLPALRSWTRSQDLDYSTYSFRSSTHFAPLFLNFLDSSDINSIVCSFKPFFVADESFRNVLPFKLFYSLKNEKYLMEHDLLTKVDAIYELFLNRGPYRHWRWGSMWYYWVSTRKIGKLWSITAENWTFYSILLHIKILKLKKRTCIVEGLVMLILNSITMPLYIRQNAR